MKKLYIQPQTDLVRMANGEPIMERSDDMLVGSGGNSVNDKWGNAPQRKAGTLYI